MSTPAALGFDGSAGGSVGLGPKGAPKLSPVAIGLIVAAGALFVVVVVLAVLLGVQSTKINAAKSKLRQMGPAIAGGLGLVTSTNTIPGPLNQFPVTGLAASTTEYVHGQIMPVADAEAAKKADAEAAAKKAAADKAAAATLQAIKHVQVHTPTTASPSRQASAPPPPPSQPQPPVLAQTQPEPPRPMLASMQPPKIPSFARVGGNLAMPPVSESRKVASMDPEYAKQVADTLAASAHNPLDSHFLRGAVGGRDPGFAPAPGPGPAPTPGPGSMPGPAPTPAPAQPAPAQPAAQGALVFVTAEEVMGLVGGSDVFAVIMVMAQCPACHRMKAALNSMLAAGKVDPRRLRLLDRDEWVKVQQTFATNAAPQVFRVGQGKVEKGMTGSPDSDATAAALADFINFRG